MKNKMNLYNILIYIVLVFALSGLSLLLNLVFQNARNYSLTFPQFAPALALVVLLVVRQNKGVIFDIKQRFGISKKGWTYCLASIAALSAVFFIFSYSLNLLNNTFSQWETPSLTISILCIIAGCIAEEIGWRGFLLPALNQKLPLISSALVVGIIWGAWHFDFENGIVGYLFSIMFMTALSIIISWVQVKSNGSIIPAILIHFFINMCAHTILFNMSFSMYQILSAILACVGFIVFVADRKIFMLIEISRN